MTALDHRKLYRLPWTFSDNVIAWLEPTSKCNLACEGCYRANIDSHKSLETIREELETFRKFRKFDGVSIAGGDPLTHPEVPRIVELVAEMGWKPVVNTNGLALTPNLLRSLKDAGLTGFTFHIDSHQNRPGWKDADEMKLCELRLALAQMVHEAGNLSVAFNATVYEDTLDDVPRLVDWAQRHIDLVHVMVFIAYREAVCDGSFDYFNGGDRVDVKPLVYSVDRKKQRDDISSREMVAKVQEKHPDFMPAAYLGGTEKPDSLKWLLSTRIGTSEEIFGYAGPRFMEAVQTTHHAVTGRYLAYAAPNTLQMGRATLAGAAFDPSLRTAAANYAKWVAKDPLRAFEKLYVQSVMFIQPVDVLADGRQNMCDGCPDITVHEGELVWSCRLEERLKYGRFLTTAPKGKAS